jgi:hypothetical protein
MEFTKKFKAYVLVDPETNVPRYVGITTRTLQQRFAGHMNDINNRPTLNPHKTNWFHKLMRGGKLPRIEQVAEFDNEVDMKQFEIDYIQKYKDVYNLINQTLGGDSPGFRMFTRESILKRSNIRPIVQYNVLGEKIAEFEMTEDAAREYNFKDKACSHITQCCKGTRHSAYGYIWRYKDEPLGNISTLNPRSLEFNKLVQYDLNGNRIAEYDSYMKASEAIGDHSKGANISAVALGKQNTCKGYYFQVEPTYVYFDQKLFDEAYSNFRKVKQPICERGFSVDKLDMDGNYLETYNSLSDASEKTYGTKNSRKKIKECLEGRDSFKGYKWRFSINATNSEDELTESIPSDHNV